MKSSTEVDEDSISFNGSDIVETAAPDVPRRSCCNSAVCVALPADKGWIPNKEEPANVLLPAYSFNPKTPA